MSGCSCPTSGASILPPATTMSSGDKRAASGKAPIRRQFAIAPGFRIELVRSAAADEDSWISLVFDPQGRAIISQEQQGLLRMTLAKDGKVGAPAWSGSMTT